MSQQDPKEITIFPKATQLEIIELDDIALDAVTGGKSDGIDPNLSNTNCAESCTTNSGCS